MAETVLSFVLDQLSTFLREEGRLLGGLREEVQLITYELGHMRAFLKVAEAKEEDDPRLQEWVKQVREVAYDTEDVLDEFVFRFARRRPQGFYGFVREIFNSIKSFRARRRVASEIQSVKTKIKSSSERRERYQSEYGISDRVSGSLVPVNNNAWRYSRDDALLVDETRLVGIDEPKQQLICQLLEGDSQLKVISVVGMGGLGKITLIKKVHEDAYVRRHFPIRAWVTVSQTFDFQYLLKNLIRQLHVEINQAVPQLIDSMTTFELKRFVKDFLQQGRYIIVFDDVWDVEFWNEIKLALPENSYGNRVMLTTRIADVASASCIETQSYYVHKMQPLSFEDSWTLFCNKTFEDKSCPAHLRDVAKTILNKCEGLPLAIVAISGLLAMKGVSKMDEWEITRRSLGGELEGTGKLDRVKKILCLSYNDLPSHLKTCMLYISIYPEDYKIPCFQLTRLWIAERFVVRREGMTVEDVAWDYFRELVDWSLIQVTDVFCEGTPRYCHMHDILREVIFSISKEQNMVTVSTGLHISWPDNVRRLVIHNFFGNSPQHSFCFKHLRSLITFGSKEPLSETLLFEILSSKLIKVLDLTGYTQLEEIPNEIFKLFHLKYLSLSGTRVKIIPKSIGKLQNLEFLNLSETEVKELPTEILKLQKFRHVLVYQKVDLVYQKGYYGFKAPSKIGELLGLHTLAMIDAGAARGNDETSAIVKEIGKLTQLRILGITNLRREYGKELCYSLEKLTNIQELSIYSVGKDEVIDLNYSFSTPSVQSLRMLILWGRLEKMPQWMTCLQGLVRIDLDWSGLMEDPLESLQRLPNLVHVNMRQAYQGEGLCFKAGGFLKLKELYLRGLQGLRSMRVEEGAMPRLQQLILQDLPLLVELPLGIQHLRNLQKLDLAYMNSQLMEKLENKGSEDYYRQVAHIPQVVISVWRDGEWKERQLWRK